MVFNGEFDFKPTHISLYMFLLNQNNRANWIEWFKCPFDTVMLGACINSNKTYYKVLNELQDIELIEYQKGINLHKAPRIKIIPLNQDLEEKIPIPEDSTSVIITQLTTLLSTLLSTQLTTQLTTQLCTHLREHKDILLTSNYKLVTSIDNTNSEELDYNSILNSENFKKFLKGNNLELKSKNKPESEKFNFKKSFIELGVDEKIISDWLIVRKAKKASNTETAFKAIKNQIEKIDATPNECIELAVVKNWIGFKAEWYNNSITHKNNDIQKYNNTSPKKNINYDCFWYTNNEKGGQFLASIDQEEKIKEENKDNKFFRIIRYQ